MNFKLKIRYTIAFSILLIAILKTFLPAPVNSKERIRDFWINKTHQNNKYNIIVAGDSRIYRGFAIKKMTNNLNKELSAFNMGYMSAGFNNYYLDLVISKLDTNANTKILILGLSPHSLTPEAAKNEQLVNLTKLNLLQIYRALYWTPFFNFFETYQPSVLFGKDAVNYKQDYRSTGWVASYKVTPDSTEALTSYRKSFSKYQVEEEIVSAFLRRIEMIKKAGVEIIAFRPPSTPEMRLLEDNLSGFKEEEVVNELKERGVIWIDFNDADFVSYDGSHLHYTSAEKLSKLIADRINELILKKE